MEPTLLACSRRPASAAHLERWADLRGNVTVTRQSLCGILLAAVLSSGCPAGESLSTETGARSSTDCSTLAVENPYDEGSGHYAGFDWAARNDVSSCGGNSASFIEGCQEFQRQVAAYKSCQSGR